MEHTIFRRLLVGPSSTISATTPYGSSRYVYQGNRARWSERYLPTTLTSRKEPVRFSEMYSNSLVLEMGVRSSTYSILAPRKNLLYTEYGVPVSTCRHGTTVLR